MLGCETQASRHERTLARRLGMVSSSSTYYIAALKHVRFVLVVNSALSDWHGLYVIRPPSELLKPEIRKITSKRMSSQDKMRMRQVHSFAECAITIHSEEDFHAGLLDVRRKVGEKGETRSLKKEGEREACPPAFEDQKINF